MEHSWQKAIRDNLLVLLTLTTGAVDASSILRVGHVFSSVITGNLVLLGIAAATLRGPAAIHSAVALAGYMVGVLIGAPIASRQAVGGGTWPPSVTITLVAEFCVLTAFSVGWELTGGHPGSAAQFLLAALTAMAMGIQSAAVQRLGGMSTTYMTGTLTQVITELVTRVRPPGSATRIWVFAAIIFGAGLGGVVAIDAPAWLPAVILAPLAAVVIGSIARFAPVRAHLGPRGDR
jgi:uncharacterized membrane protein YoaK (UPF0700 family)